MGDTKRNRMKTETVKPHLIHTQFIVLKRHYSAFVTWRGYDLQEYGETERNAVLFLIQKHAKFLGIDNVDDFITKVRFGKQ